MFMLIQLNLAFCSEFSKCQKMCRNEQVKSCLSLILFLFPFALRCSGSIFPTDNAIYLYEHNQNTARVKVRGNKPALHYYLEICLVKYNASLLLQKHFKIILFCNTIDMHQYTRAHTYTHAHKISSPCEILYAQQFERANAFGKSGSVHRVLLFLLAFKIDENIT